MREVRLVIAALTTFTPGDNTLTIDVRAQVCNQLQVCDELRECFASGEPPIFQKLPRIYAMGVRLQVRFAMPSRLSRTEVDGIPVLPLQEDRVGENPAGTVWLALQANVV